MALRFLILLNTIRKFKNNKLIVLKLNFQLIKLLLRLNQL